MNLVKSLILTSVFVTFFIGSVMGKHFEATILIPDVGVLDRSHSADLDGDGHDDLIYGSPNNNSIAVFLNSTNAMFQSMTYYNTIHPVTSIFAADLDGDTDKDVAVSIKAISGVTQDSILVFFNDGNGNLSTPDIYAGGWDPTQIIAVDVNDDTYLDLVYSNDIHEVNVSDVSVMINNGDGTFQSEYTFGNRGFAQGVLARDFNGDDEPDLAVMNASVYGVTILLNNGAGTFIEDEFYSLTSRPLGFDAGDIDGDSDIDIVLGAQFPLIHIIQNNGDGTFIIGDIFCGSYPQPLLADLELDGDLDIVTIDRTNKRITTFYNDGTGAYPQYNQFNTGVLPKALARGDFDADGILDFATANNNKFNITIFISKGDGTFPEAPSIYGGINPVNITAADFNKNGYDDFAIGNVYLNDTSFNLVLNSGSSGFNAPNSFEVPGAGNTQSITAADFDSDGNIDVALINGFLNFNISIFLSSAPGEFEPGVLVDMNGNFNATSIVSADINFDNDIDLLVASEQTGVEFTVYKNDGAGSFALDAEYNIGAHAFRVFPGDVDGDTDIDVVLALRTTDAVAVMFNDGTGSYGGMQTYAVGDQPRGVVLANIDSDSDLDIVTANYSGSASVLLNNGDGTFGSRTDYQIPAQETFMVPIDIDQDGFTDVAAVSEVGALTTLISNGDGTLSYPISYLISPGWSYGATVADVNADGVPDIAAVATNVWIYKNRTEPNYVCGDADGSGTGSQITDLNYLVNYVFRSGPPPIPFQSGNVNGDSTTNLLDLNFLVNFIFRGGPAAICP